MEPKKINWKKLLLDYNVVIVFCVMLILSSIFSDVFFSAKNLTNILRQVTSLGLVSFGMLMVILTGGIDLSVGSLMAFSSVVFAQTLAAGQSFGVSVVFAVVILLLMGACSGVLVAWANMAPFVATLAMMTIARGSALILAKGSPIFIDNPTLTLLGSGYVAGIPIPAIILAIAFILFYLGQNKTSAGRIIKAIGSNENAVRLTGIRVSLYKFGVYCVSAIMCALGGIISTARTEVGSSIIGVGFELDVIAAVVIGGASLGGGRGWVLNTLLGAIILGVIRNIMNLMGLPGYPQEVIKGGIIIVAVFFQSFNFNVFRILKLRKTG